MVINAGCAAVSDTSSQCMTITRSRWATRWADSCYDVNKWVWPWYKFSGAVKAAANVKDKLVDIKAADIGSYAGFAFNVAPNTEQELSLEIARINSVTVVLRFVTST